jgi:hypothetical protein
MSTSDNGIIADGQGILVGVQPAQPQQAIQQPRPDQAVTQPVQVVEQRQPQTNLRYTEEDLTRARQEEQHRLNERMEEMSAQLGALQQERQAELAERQRQIDEQQAALKAKEEEEMDLRTLMERREAEMRAELESINQRYETDRAVFERERALVEAQQYRIQRIEQEAEYIIPELRDLVGGDTPEQVDASIEEMKARSEAIFTNMQQQMQPQPFRGAASPGVPPVGPMEQLPSYEQLSPEDIKNMDMDTYKRYRQQLLAATSPRNRGR